MVSISVHIVVWTFWAMAVFSGFKLINEFNIICQTFRGHKKTYERIVGDYIIQGVIHSAVMVLCCWALFSLYIG